MLTVNRTSWHYKVYIWWYRHKYGYSSKQFFTKATSNLCPYMRAVMFWAPLRAIFWNWIKVKKVPTNVIILPIIAFSLPFGIGYLDYKLKMILWATYALAVFCSLVLTCIVGCAYLFDEDGLGWGKHIIESTNRVKSSSFLELIREYLRSAHDRICPEVSFNSEDISNSRPSSD